MTSSSNQLLRQIIAEEAAILKANLNLRYNDRFGLFEYMTQSKINPNFKPDPSHAWEPALKQTEKALKNLGAGIMPVGTFGSYGYELDVQPEAGGPGDRLWFYEDAVQSTNQVKDYEYRLKNGKIELLNSSDKAIGTIERIGDKVIFKETEEAKKEKAEKEKKAHPNQAREWLKTALDVLGVVEIYGIGTVADLIGAYLYFEDGEIFEGCLSLVALVPLVGDALKFTFKFAIRGVKGLKTAMKGAKNAQEVFEILKQSKKLDPDLLKKVHESFMYVADKCPEARNALQKHRDEIRAGAGMVAGPFGMVGAGKYVDDLINKIDDLEAWLKTGTNSIDDLGDAAKGLATGGPKAFGMLADMPDALKTPTGWKKFVGSLTGGVIPTIKKMPWFPTKKVAQINFAIMDKFAKAMSKHPTELTRLYGFAPKATELSNNIDKILMNATTNPILRNALDGIKSTSTVTNKLNKSGKSFLTKNSARTVNDILSTLKRNPAKEAQELYTRLSTEIIQHSIKNNSVVYGAYRANVGTQLRTFLLSPKSMEAGRQFAEVGALATDLKQYLPLIWNEMQDIGSKFGLTPEKPDGIILPLIDGILGLNNTSLKDIKNDVYKKLGIPDPEKADAAANTIMDIGKNAAGLGDTDSYDPNTGATGTYR